MTRFLARLLLAFTAEALCERIRPTRRYVMGGYYNYKVGNRLLRHREGGVCLRRPWQSSPEIYEPVTLPTMWGAVKMPGLVVYPERRGV